MMNHSYAHQLAAREFTNSHYIHEPQALRKQLNLMVSFHLVFQAKEPAQSGSKKTKPTGKMLKFLNAHQNLLITILNLREIKSRAFFLSKKASDASVGVAKRKHHDSVKENIKEQKRKKKEVSGNLVEVLSSKSSENSKEMISSMKANTEMMVRQMELNATKRIAAQFAADPNGEANFEKYLKFTELLQRKKDDFEKNN